MESTGEKGKSPSLQELKHLARKSIFVALADQDEFSDDAGADGCGTAKNGLDGGAVFDHFRFPHDGKPIPRQRCDKFDRLTPQHQNVIREWESTFEPQIGLRGDPDAPDVILFRSLWFKINRETRTRFPVWYTVKKDVATDRWLVCSPMSRPMNGEVIDALPQLGPPQSKNIEPDRIAQEKQTQSEESDNGRASNDPGADFNQTTGKLRPYFVEKPDYSDPTRNVRIAIAKAEAATDPKVRAYWLQQAAKHLARRKKKVLEEMKDEQKLIDLCSPLKWRDARQRPEYRAVVNALTTRRHQWVFDLHINHGMTLKKTAKPFRRSLRQTKRIWADVALAFIAAGLCVPIPSDEETVTPCITKH